MNSFIKQELKISFGKNIIPIEISEFNDPLD